MRLWFRRDEARELKTSEVKERILNIQGKGRRGGKRRTLAWAPDTAEELRQYMKLREEMVARARCYQPDAIDPQAFFTYQKGKRLHAYENTAIDNMVKTVAKQAGIKITLLSDQNKTVTKAYDVLFPNLAGMYETSARAAFVIGTDGVIKYAEQTPTPKDLPNFAAVKAALA